MKTAYIILILSFLQLAPVLYPDESLILSTEKLHEVSQTRYLMGALATISAWGKEEALTSEAVNLAFEAMEKVDKLMSNYKPESELSQINGQAGKHPVRVSPQTMEVVKASILYSQLSDGAFDPTISPLVKSWGFFKKEGAVPSEEEIRHKRALVDYGQIRIDEKNGTVFLLRPRMEIDLGGIAKGYGVDKAVEQLKNYGITAALVNLSGNIYALGSPPDRLKWEVGVKDPTSKEAFIGALSLKDKAISSSGNYENYFMIDGKRYGHLIDPKTGYPVANKMLGITAVSDNAMAADALSTAMFILGVEKAKDLIQRLDGIVALIVYEKENEGAEIWVSEGLKDSWHR